VGVAEGHGVGLAERVGTGVGEGVGIGVLVSFGVVFTGGVEVTPIAAEGHGVGD